VNDLVNVIGGHARLRFAGCDIEHFTCQSADLTHTILLFLREDLDLIPSSEHLAKHQHLVCHIQYTVSTHLLALGHTM
jgi:hypothetical protein